MFTLPVILAMVGLAVGGVRLGWVLWKGAKTTGIERWVGEQLVLLKEATLQLTRRYKDIDDAPDQSGDDLTDSLNDAWKKKD